MTTSQIDNVFWGIPAADYSTLFSRDDVRARLRWFETIAKEAGADPLEDSDAFWIAVYWVSTQWHSGMNDPLYALSSAGPYRPGAMEEETAIADGMVYAIFKALDHALRCLWSYAPSLSPLLHP